MRRSERVKRQLRKGSGIAVIGEGPTEQYYLLSIQGIWPVNIYPKIVKDGMDYLISKVEDCLADGYDKVYCLIDMDNKSGQKEKDAYASFLRRFAGKKFKNNQTGGFSEVIIIENHPCLEIWFYYYFRLTTGVYSSYEKLNPLKPELRKYLPEYEKRIEFFKKCGGLHQYLTAKGGDIMKAIENSNLSMTHRDYDNEGAFSQMALMVNDIIKR